MLQRTDVFIIGGGPAGLAAAIAARERAFAASLVDGWLRPIGDDNVEASLSCGNRGSQPCGASADNEHVRPLQHLHLVRGELKGPPFSPLSPQSNMLTFRGY